MKTIPLVERTRKYPEFIPVHPELLRDGVSLTAAVVYGYYELAVRQKGVLSIAGSLAVECPTRKVAKDLNLSSSQIKRARQELVNAGLIRSIKQAWGRPSLTVVYTYTLNDDPASSTSAVPDPTPASAVSPAPTRVAKADSTAASSSVPGTSETSPVKEADHAPATPPEGQDKSTSVPPSEGVSEGAPVHCLEGAVEPSDGSSVTSRKGTVATSHSTICAISPPYSKRGKPSLQAYGRYGNVMLTDEEYQDIRDKLGEYADRYIDHFSSRLNERHYRYSDHHREILDWWAGDKDTWLAKGHTSQHQSPAPGEAGNSFDTDEFVDAALRRSMGDELVDQLRYGQDRI